MRSASIDLVSVEDMKPGARVEVTGIDLDGDVNQMTLIKTVQDSILETKMSCLVATADGGEEPRDIDAATGFALPELANEYFYMVSNEGNGLVRVSPVLTKGDTLFIYSEHFGVGRLEVTSIILHD